jgi:hypothetical protein
VCWCCIGICFVVLFLIILELHLHISARLEHTLDDIWLDVIAIAVVGEDIIVLLLFVLVAAVVEVVQQVLRHGRHLGGVCAVHVLRDSLALLRQVA